MSSYYVSPEAIENLKKMSDEGLIDLCKKVLQSIDNYEKKLETASNLAEKDHWESLKVANTHYYCTIRSELESRGLTVNFE